MCAIQTIIMNAAKRKFFLTDCAWKEDLKIVEAVAEHDFCFQRLPEMFAQWKEKSSLRGIQ